MDTGSAPKGVLLVTVATVEGVLVSQDEGVVVGRSTRVRGEREEEHHRGG
jgi:hypothetical protein